MSGKFGSRFAGQSTGRDSVASERGDEVTALPEAAPAMRTILGAGCTFEGKIICAGPTRVGGNFSGEIRADDLVLIESNAMVLANLKVKELVVHGIVKGNVVATKSISLAASAQIEGDIQTSCMTMEVGAQVKGKIDVAPATTIDGDTPAEEPLASAAE